MKSKSLIIFLILITLISCSKKIDDNKSSDKDNKQQISSNDEKQLKSFFNKDESYIKISEEKNILMLETKDISYSVDFLSRKGELDDFLVKKVKLTKTPLGRDDYGSSFHLDIFTTTDFQKIHSTDVFADNITLNTYFYKVDTYGCCGAEDYFELLNFWEDKVFLKYNTKYYVIEVPNSHIDLYFGFLADSRNEKDLILGELYFAHSLPYDIKTNNLEDKNFKIVNKITFKAANKELFDKILPFTPETTLLKNTDKDRIVDNKDSQVMTLWSYNDVSGVSKISFTALKLKFENDIIDDLIVDIEIPIQNGYLFGEPDNLKKVIIVEENPKRGKSVASNGALVWRKLSENSALIGYPGTKDGSLVDYEKLYYVKDSILRKFTAFDIITDCEVEKIKNETYSHDTAGTIIEYSKGKLVKK